MTVRLNAVQSDLLKFMFVYQDYVFDWALVIQLTSSQPTNLVVKIEVIAAESTIDSAVVILETRVARYCCPFAQEDPVALAPQGLLQSRRGEQVDTRIAAGDRQIAEAA